MLGAGICPSRRETKIQERVCLVPLLVMSLTNSSSGFIFLLLAAGSLAMAAEQQDLAPSPDEQQLPRAMHSRMKERPRITVGLRDADIIGADQRALQAAVDYLAGLGGGVVEIGRASCRERV